MYCRGLRLTGRPPSPGFSVNFDEPIHLDFSQFHDLMHRLGTAECHAQFGGASRHVELWWDFIAKPAMRKATLCRIGRHHLCTAWRRDRGYFLGCSTCFDRFSGFYPDEAAIDEIKAVGRGSRGWSWRRPVRLS